MSAPLFRSTFSRCLVSVRSTTFRALRASKSFEFCRKIISVVLVYTVLGSTMPTVAALSHSELGTRQNLDLTTGWETPSALQAVNTELRTGISRSEHGLGGGALPKGAQFASLHAPIGRLQRNLHASPPPPSGASTISSNFNGTAIGAGSYIWFNSVVSVSGIATYPARVVARGGVVQFTANGKSASVAVPDNVITYSSTTSAASTHYNASLNEWETTVPASVSGNAMLTSVPLYVATALPGGINPVNWTEHFYSDNPGVSLQWQWAAAVYTNFSTDLNAIGAKPIDGNVANPYANSDHAATPENFKPYVVGGARGGGGLNWTGSNSGTASVVVPTDTAPIANAGLPQTVPVQSTVTLDGTQSSDANGDRLTFQWSLAQKPAGSTAQVTNSTNIRPTLTIDKAGDYAVQLVVNDGILFSAPAQVTISTSNSAPVAVAGSDQSAHIGVTVQLDGKGSFDIDGDALTYRWTLAVPSGSNTTLQNASTGRASFTPDKLGDYVATLVVNDGKVDSQPSSLTVTTGDVAPVADAGPAQTGKVTQTITLDGHNSRDVDGQAITYQWSFTSRPDGSNATLSTPTDAQATFLIDEPGHYAIQLVVFDGILYSQPSTTTVDTVNSPPVANAGLDQHIIAQSTVHLDGHGTTDVDGDLLSYNWSFTTWPGQDQQQHEPSLSDSSAVMPTFFASLPGTYVLQLHVDDGKGGGSASSATSTVTITSDDIPPVADPGSPQRFNVGDTITLDGSKSNSPLGYPLTYSWQLSSRPEGSNATLSNANTVSPSFTVDVLGTYVVALVVNDGWDCATATTHLRSEKICFWNELGAVRR